MSSVGTWRPMLVCKMETHRESRGIVQQAFCMSDAVARFVEQVRTFYYAAALSSRKYPECGGSLVTIHEGRCRCQVCSR